MIKLKTSIYTENDFIIPAINLELESNVKKIAVFGSNGSGKTSFFKLLQGLYKTDQFSIEQGSKQLTRIDFIPQFFSVANQFIITSEFISDVLKVHGLNFENCDLSPIQNFLEKKLCVLSGGEMKRLLFWLSSVKGSQIILLDEILANLDPKGEREIFSQMIELENLEHVELVFFSSHNKDHLLNFGDWFLGFKDCEITFSGSKDSFLSSGIFEELHEI